MHQQLWTAYQNLKHQRTHLIKSTQQQLRKMQQVYKSKMQTLQQLLLHPNEQNSQEQQQFKSNHHLQHNTNGRHKNKSQKSIQKNNMNKDKNAKEQRKKKQQMHSQKQHQKLKNNHHNNVQQQDQSEQIKNDNKSTRKLIYSFNPTSQNNKNVAQSNTNENKNKAYLHKQNRKQIISPNYDKYRQYQQQYKVSPVASPKMQKLINQGWKK